MSTQIQNVKNDSVYAFSVYFVSEGFKLKDLQGKFDFEVKSTSPDLLFYELDEKKFFLIYKFGSVVFFNLTKSERKLILDKLNIYSTIKRESFHETEDFYLLEEQPDLYNRVYFNKVVVTDLDLDKLTIISLVLAKSAALDFFESQISDLFEKLLEITDRAKKARFKKFLGSEILKLMSKVMVIRQKIISSTNILEKPDQTWDDKVLHDLHIDATKMFELKERFRNLDYKLNIMRDSLEIMANLSSNRHMVIMEALIVIFFAIDIVLVLYEIFFQ